MKTITILNIFNFIFQYNLIRIYNLFFFKLTLILNYFKFFFISIIKNKSLIFFSFKLFFFLKIFNYINIYNSVLNALLFNFNFFLNFKKKKDLPFSLNLKFYKNNFSFNLLNKFKKNILFLSAGFFLKFFEKKKNFKKSKTIKLMAIKLIKKILFILKISTIVLCFKKTPLFINEILLNLNQTSNAQFNNPLNNKLIKETTFDLFFIKTPYFIFTDNKSYTILKKKNLDVLNEK